MHLTPYSKLGRNSILPEYKTMYAREYDYRIIHYRLELWVSIEDKHIDGIATISIVKNGRVSSRMVELDACALKIKKVYDDFGPLRYDYDGKILRVYLRRKLSSRPKNIIVEYSVDEPEEGLYFVDNPPIVWSQGETEWNRYWMPIYDYPNMKFSTEMVIHVKKGFKAFSNGVLLRHESGKDWDTWHYIFEHPHSGYLIALVVGDFEVYEEEIDGVKLEYVVPRGMGKYVKETFKNVPDMLRFFNEWLGVKYPFKVYRQVVVNRFVVGGMENTTITLLTTRALLDKHARLDIDSEGLLSHELAHQWFGDLITCKDWGSIWINESFATFMANVYYRHWKGEDEFIYQLYLGLQSYLNEYKNWYSRPIVLRLYKYPEEVFDAHSYPKGGLILNMLRNLLGEDLFRDALKEFLLKFKYGNADTEDFKKVVEAHYGYQLDWFFDQFIYNAGHPVISVEYSYNPKDRLLSIKLGQKQGEDSLEIYKIPIEILVVRRDGRTVKLDVWFEEREKSIYVPLKEEPDYVLVDPEFKVFAVIEPNYPLETKIKILEKSRYVYWRLLMARALAKETSRRAIDSLASAVEKDKFYGVSREAARSLGDIRTEYAKEKLLYLLDKVENHRVRAEIVRSLRNYKGKDVAERLIKILEDRGEAYTTRANAAEAIGKIRYEKAYDILIKYLEEPSHRYIITKGVLSGLSELGTDEAFKIIIEYTSMDKEDSLRAHAVSLLGKFPERRETYRKLMEYIYDREVRFRRGVIMALKELMDPRAIPILEAIVRRERWGWIWKAAKIMLRQIKEHVEKGVEWKKLREELVRLQDETRRLEDRVYKIELRG
jgi:aminopeptidase N